MPGANSPIHSEVFRNDALQEKRRVRPVTKAKNLLRALSVRAAATTMFSGLSGLSGSSFGSAAIAADGTALADALLFTSANVMMLAVFGGAMSFAILSATWLIRERARMTGENDALKMRVSGLRASNERLEALASAGDQVVVVWDGADEKPAILGRLSKASGAPSDRAAFLAFGRWLTADSAISFEGALKRLRANAEAFDLPLTTKTGVIEAQGRTSGSHAFVRFIELSGERSALARLEAEHARLLATFDSIQTLFEQLPMPVWLRDPAGELFWVNNAYAKAVDSADGEQAVDRRLQLLDSAERNEVARKQRETGTYRGTLPAVIAGDRRTLDYTEVKTAAGNAGIAVDRSDMEAVRATLKQTNASHAQTLDHLATAIAMFDKAQQLQFYNSSFQKLFGLPAGLLESQPSNAQVFDAMRAERKLPDFPDWRKWRETQLSIYKAVDAREDWWHLADGRVLRVVANPHSQGGATWVFENVTEQVELRTNYNSLMRIQGETLDNLSEAVAVFGSDGRLKLHNPAFAKIWNVDAELFGTGKHISGLSKPLSDKLTEPQAWSKIVDAITGFDDARDDLSGRLDTVDGKVVDYALVRLPEGQTMLAVVDMTATVHVERALKDRNEALEQADRLKNRFLQHVSYELRAPLTSISGFAEMLEMPEIGKLNSKQHEYVGHITGSADTLKHIIDDILDLATIDAGAMTLDFEPVNVGEVLAECSNALLDATGPRGITIENRISAGAQQFLADRRRIGQILANLLDNAVRFSPDGGKVSISTARSGDTLEIVVADEGPGVPLENRASIFERFEGQNAGDKRRGTGLGLSLVKSFVELHGGSVSVENAGERGAKFVCRFPRAAA